MKALWVVVALVVVENALSVGNYLYQGLFGGTQVRSLLFSPDSQMVYGAGSDSLPQSQRGWIWAWNTKDGRLRWKTHVTEPVETAQLSPDGTSLLTLASEGTPRLWNTATGALRCAFNVDPTLGMAGDAYFTPDGKRVLGGFQNGIQVWDAATGKRIAFWRMRKGETGWPRPLQFSKEGSRVLIGIIGWEGGAEYKSSDPYDIECFQVWDTQNGSVLGSYTGSSTIAALSPAGDKVAMINRRYKNDLGYTSWIKLHTIRAHSRSKVSPRFDMNFEPKSLEFRPDGNILCDGENSHDYLWETSNNFLIAKTDRNIDATKIYAPNKPWEVVINSGGYQNRPPLGTIYGVKSGEKLTDLEGLAGR